MLLGAVPQWLIDLGSAAGAVLAVCGLLAVVSKSRLGRWLWRTLVSTPLTHWLTATIRTVTDPILEAQADAAAKTDETAIALVTHMTDEVALRESDMKDQAAWRDEVRGELVAIKGEMRRGHAELGGRVDVVHERLAETLVALAAGNPELRPGQLEPEDDARPIYAPAAAASGLIGPPPRRPTIRPEDA